MQFAPDARNGFACRYVVANVRGPLQSLSVATPLSLEPVLAQRPEALRPRLAASLPLERADHGVAAATKSRQSMAWNALVCSEK